MEIKIKPGSILVIIFIATCLLLYRNKLQPPNDDEVNQEKIQNLCNEDLCYATFYISIPTDTRANSKEEWSKYAFLAPYTVIAWNKINYTCIVGLVYDGKKMTNDSYTMMKLLAETLRVLEAEILYINVDVTHIRQISNSLRLFTSHLISRLPRNAFLMTASVDIWPLRAQHYHPSANYTTLLLDSDCCGKISYQNILINSLPMRIGMLVAKWKQIFPIYLQKHFTSSTGGRKPHNTLPNVQVDGNLRNYYEEEDLKFIEMLLSSMWGRERYVTVQQDQDWHMDCNTLSVYMHYYQQTHGTNGIKFYPNSKSQLNRIHWEKDLNDMHYAKDAYVLRSHLFDEKFEYNRLQMLMRRAFTKAERKLLDYYRANFIKYFFGILE